MVPQSNRDVRSFSMVTFLNFSLGICIIRCIVYFTLVIEIGKRHPANQKGHVPTACVTKCMCTP